MQALTERLAEHVHDVWSRQRLADGWRYGPERNDTQKEHPSLVPYSELTDLEQEYDRLTALETLESHHRPWLPHREGMTRHGA